MIQTRLSYRLIMHRSNTNFNSYTPDFKNKYDNYLIKVTLLVPSRFCDNPISKIRGDTGTLSQNRLGPIILIN